MSVVYVLLLEFPYEGSVCSGVFTTRAKAQAAIDAYGQTGGEWRIAELVLDEFQTGGA